MKMVRQSIHAFDEELCTHLSRVALSNLGPLLSVYTAPIRALKSMEAVLKNNDPKEQSVYCEKIVTRPIKMSPHFVCAFRNFCAARSVPGWDTTTIEQLVKQFSRDELVDFLAMTYTYKLTAKKIPNANLELFTTKIAAVVGVALALDKAGSMVPWYSLATPFVLGECGFQLLAKSEQKKCDVLERGNKRQKIVISPEAERDMIGCSRFHIASLIAGELGFGLSYREELSTLGNSSVTDFKQEQLVMLICLEQLLLDAEPSQSKLYPLLPAEAKELLGKVEIRSEHIQPDVVWLTASELEESTAEASTSNIVELPSHQKRALIIDDEFSSASIIKKLLGEEFECIVAVDGQSATEVYTESIQNKEVFDLIILDLILPDIHGLELLSSIRATEQVNSLSPAKVLVLSGIGEAEQVVEAYEKGVNGYLTKPIHPGELKSELAKIGFSV